MRAVRVVRWTLLPLALALIAGGGWIVLQPVHSKGRHGEAHRHGQSQEAAPSMLSMAEAEQASTLYVQSCAACHGERLEGAVGPSLVGIGSRFTREKIEQIAQQGKGRKKPTPMPSGLATPEEANLLARWLTANRTANEESLH